MEKFFYHAINRNFYILKDDKLTFFYDSSCFELSGVNKFLIAFVNGEYLIELYYDAYLEKSIDQKILLESGRIIKDNVLYNKDGRMELKVLYLND